MAEFQLPKLATRVRFPSPAPLWQGLSLLLFWVRESSVRNWSPFRCLAQILPFSQKIACAVSPTGRAWLFSLHPLHFGRVYPCFYFGLGNPLFEIFNLLTSRGKNYKELVIFRLAAYKRKNKRQSRSFR